MKTLKIVSATLLLSLILVSSSCKKNNVKPVDPVPTPKGVTVQFTPYFGSSKMEFGEKLYLRKNGEQVLLRNWDLLVSKFSLIDNNNKLVQLGDGYQYISFENNRVSFNYKDIPAGTYKGVYFILGVDSWANHDDPTRWGADHPLNPNVNHLHWGWAGGYIFQQVDGNYKVPGNETLKGMSYHTATDQFKLGMTLLYDFTVNSVNELKTVNISADFEKYLDGPPNTLTIDQGASSHSQGDAEIALMTKIVANQSSVFKIDSVK